MTPAIAALVAIALNWDAIPAAQQAYTTITTRERRGGTELRISTNDPGSHLTGLKMRTTPQGKRERGDGPVVNAFYLDKGIFTGWRFIGGKGSDRLEFGPQGHIISKRSGGVVDFGRDNVRDVFVFTNRIDVAKCSEKHGFPCHPLNHLQRVVIKNMGPEDLIVLQGKRFGAGQVINGALPGVPVDRLRVELQTGNVKD
jgi:hypothetical protein